MRTAFATASENIDESTNINDAQNIGPEKKLASLKNDGTFDKLKNDIFDASKQEDEIENLKHDIDCFSQSYLERNFPPNKQRNVQKNEVFTTLKSQIDDDHTLQHKIMRAFINEQTKKVIVANYKDIIFDEELSENEIDEVYNEVINEIKKEILNDGQNSSRASTANRMNDQNSHNYYANSSNYNQRTNSYKAKSDYFNMRDQPNLLPQHRLVRPLPNNQFVQSNQPLTAVNYSQYAQQNHSYHHGNNNQNQFRPPSASQMAPNQRHNTNYQQQNQMHTYNNANNGQHPAPMNNYNNYQQQSNWTNYQHFREFQRKNQQWKRTNSEFYKRYNG